MLAEPANAPFNNPEWIYEPKWDGIRATAYVHGEQVRLFSRNLQNFTGLFASIAESLKAVGVPIVLDGEVVALGAEGRPDFRYAPTLATPREAAAYRPRDLHRL